MCIYSIYIDVFGVWACICRSIRFFNESYYSMQYTCYVFLVCKHTWHAAREILRGLLCNSRYHHFILGNSAISYLLQDLLRLCTGDIQKLPNSMIHSDQCRTRSDLFGCLIVFYIPRSKQEAHARKLATLKGKGSSNPTESERRQFQDSVHADEISYALDDWMCTQFFPHPTRWAPIPFRSRVIAPLPWVIAPVIHF